MLTATRVGATDLRPAPAGRAGRSTAIAVAVGLVPAAVLAALAFSGIGERAFWMDEVWSVDIASRPLGGVLDVVANREANMGLYYVLLSVWLHLGQDEATVRSLSAFAAIATVIATGVLGAHMFNRLVAFTSTVVLGTSAFLLSYAQEARAYALVALVAVASFAAFVRMVERGEKRDLALWVVASTVLVYLHMLAALLIVAQAASLLAARDVQWRRVAFASGALALACSPLLAFALAEDKGQSDWIPRVAALDALTGALGNLSGGRLLVGVFGLLAVCALIAGVRRWRVAGRSDHTFRLALVACWAAVPPLALLALSQVRPLYVDRFLIGMLPGVCPARRGRRRRAAAVARASEACAALAGGARHRCCDRWGGPASRTRPANQSDERGSSSRSALPRAFRAALRRPRLLHQLEPCRLVALPAPGALATTRERSRVQGVIAPARRHPRRRGVAGDADRTDATALEDLARVVSVSGWNVAPDPVRVSGVAVLRSEFTRVRRVEFGTLRLDLYRRAA